MNSRSASNHSAWLCGLILTAILCVGPVSSARAGSPAAPSAPPAPAPSLNLTTAQQQKLTALETASHTQADQLYTQIRQLRSKLADLYGAYTLDAGEAKRLNNDLNHVQGQLLDLRLSEQQGLRGILTADQFAQLQATMKQHRGGWNDRSHDHGGHH